MRQPERPVVGRVAAASIAPFLILFAPFLSYVQYQGHGFGNPEVLTFTLLMAGLAVLLGAASVWSLPIRVLTLAGLLTFLVDVQARDPGLKRLGLLFLGLSLVLWLLRRHAGRIVTVMMLTLVASLLLFPVRFEGAPAPARAAITGREDLPLVVHLLLDEFIGTEGLPPGLAPAGFKQQQQAYFIDRGFRLFGKAYSEYPTTEWSVPQLLNLAPGGYRSDLSAPGPTAGTYRLTRNAYFERLAALGYAIRVHEPDYLYLCPDNVPASCRTYATRSLEVLNQLTVPLTAKLSVVAGTFLCQSDVYTRTKDKYREIRQRLAGKVSLPAWDWDRGIPTTAASMQMFDAVSHDVKTARRGTAVFAHILIPHYPYVYDAGCRQRPVREWMDRSDPDRADMAHGIMNVAEGRAARYAAYLGQVACTERKIDEVIDAIPEPLRHDAVLIVQGDHGSRITTVDPSTLAARPPTPTDFADAFSTMFAVRSSAIEAGYDLRTAPIPCLLRTLVESDFHSTASLAACSSPNTVYFMAGGQPPEPRPLAAFGTATPPEVAAATSGAGERPPLAGPVASPH